MAHVFNDTEKLCTRWGENEWYKKRPKSSREESPALDGFTVGQTLQTQDQYSWRHSTRKFLKWNTGKRQEKSNIISVTIKRDNRKLERICDGKYLKKMAKILQIWWKLICKKINKSQAEENYATPVFLPGESDGQRSLAGCCPWGRKESDMTEATSVSQSVSQSVQSLSHVQLFATWWIAVHQASLSITNSQSLFKFMPIESVMPSSHLILCRPLLLLPPIPPNIRVFSNELTLRMRWPKYWSFSFSISPSNEYPGLIFRMDWLDLLAVQGTLKSLLQHHSSKASIFRHSAFFTVQLTSIHDHWKNHSLDQTDLCWQSNVSAF